VQTGLKNCTNTLLSLTTVIWNLIMLTVVLSIHLILAVCLVGAVLLQRSEGGGLGMGGGSGGGGGGMGGLMTGRDSASLMTRTTGILAAGFMTTSMILAIMAGGHSKPTSIMEQPSATQQPAQPEVPQGPKVPQAQ
jgi:preprotein translocase subunit SecG